MKSLLAAPFAIIWYFAGPITYILLIVDTWFGHSSAIVKILINITLDAFLAAIWPITWFIWIFQYFVLKNDQTPLTVVLGW